MGTRPGGRPRRAERGRGRVGGRRHHDAHSRPGRPGHLPGRRGPGARPGQDPDVRPRVQHPLRRDRAAGRRGCEHGGPQVAGPPGAERVRGGPGRAGAGGRASGRERAGAGQRAGLRGRHRLHPRRRHPDHLPRGDRDRSFRRAGRAVRRRHRPGQGGVRDPDGGRLPAGDGLLRVPPRAQADRGPDVPGRHAVHALLDQRHRGVRRLHPRAPAHHRRDPGGDAKDPRRRSRTAPSPGNGWRRTGADGPTSSGCGRPTGTTRSSGSAPSCGP